MRVVREKREARPNLSASFKNVAPQVRHEALTDEVRITIPFGHFAAGGCRVRIDGRIVETARIVEVDGTYAAGVLVAMEISKTMPGWEFNGVRRAKWLVVATRAGAEIFRLRGADEVATAQQAYDRIVPAEAVRALRKGRTVRRLGRWFAVRMARAARKPVSPPTPMWRELLGEGDWKPLPALGSAA